MSAPPPSNLILPPSHSSFPRSQANALIKATADDLKALRIINEALMTVHEHIGLDTSIEDEKKREEDEKKVRLLLCMKGIKAAWSLWLIR